jgi:CRP-like cAMP-binding protein
MTDPISLRRIYLFDHLSDERLDEIKSVLESRDLAAGEILFNMGDPGDNLYIVAEGKIAIYAPSEEDPARGDPIRIFEREEAMGEMALIDHKSRSLSARALEPSRVLGLAEKDFRRFVSEDTELAFSVMNGLSDRIRYTTQFLNEVRLWVGRVTQGEYSEAQFIEEVQNWVQAVGQSDAPEDRYQDETLLTLAAEFAQMASQVKQREDELREEIAQLRIVIDQTKREEEVKGITESDFFQDLKARARELREQEDED